MNKHIIFGVISENKKITNHYKNSSLPQSSICTVFDKTTDSNP